MSLSVFPTLPGLGYPKQRNPEWKSQVEESVSGLKTGYQYWTYPRRHYVLTVNLLRSASTYTEWQSLVGFFNNVGGQAGQFLFDDPLDDSVTSQANGAGDGTTKTFQLVRTLGGFTEPVFALNGSPTVKVNGATTSVTVGNNGQITFASAPANGAAITWSGSYYWVCRFEADVIEFDEFMSGLHAVKEIKFATEKL